jgi:hypothetical protein
LRARKRRAALQTDEREEFWTREHPQSERAKAKKKTATTKKKQTAARSTKACSKWERWIFFLCAFSVNLRPEMAPLFEEHRIIFII